MFTKVPVEGSRRPRRPVERFAFTEKLLAALARPSEGSRYVYDALSAGLAVRLTPTRSCYVFYRWFRGRPEMLTLQEVGTVTLREVRAIVAGYRGDLARGIDVFARERQLKTRQTPAMLQAAFEAHLAGSTLREVSKAKYRSLWRRVPAALARKPIAGITAHELKRLHAEIGSRHQRTANLVVTVISTLLRGNGRGHDNPADEVVHFRNKVRQRVLTLDELHRFREALEQENAPWPAFFALLLWTGARRGALAQARWRDLDLDAGLWRIPEEASKNHEVITVALPGEAVELLRGMARERGASPWLFPGGSRAGHVTNPTKAWERICKRAEIEEATPHDLRRTLGTAVASDGANAATIAAVLGHRSQSSARAYIHLSAEVAREHVERAARRIARTA